MLNPTPQNGTDRRFVAYQRDSSVPGWYVSSYENVSPFEAQVIAERSHSCHKEIESAQVKAAALREKAAALDFSLRVYSKQFNYHHKIWAKAKFLEETPFIPPWLNNTLLVLIFASEIGLNSGLLDNVGLANDPNAPVWENPVLLIAWGIAAISFGSAKAAAVAIRRIQKNDPDYHKEKVMLLVGLLAMLFTLIAMVTARYSHAAATAASGQDMSTTTAIGLALLQAAFFMVAMVITYVTLPRNREVAITRDTCNSLMIKLNKLINDRASLSSRFNVIQRRTQAIVEVEKATARALLAEYWQTINANSESSIGTPAQWNDAWFPPLALGSPLEDHPATIEELLASVHLDADDS